MIGALRGEVVDISPDGAVIVDVSGVGYEVQLSRRDAEGLGPGDRVALHVHTHVREDAIVLFGFRERAGRATFEALVAARGVGPSLALAVLSTLSPDELRRAVAAGDSGALTAVPGVGPRTAARLLLELAPRLGSSGANRATVDGAGAVPASATTGDASARETVRQALQELGYGPEEIRQGLRGVDLALRELADGATTGDATSGDDPGPPTGEPASPEALLRRALRELSRGR